MQMQVKTHHSLYEQGGDVGPTSASTTAFLLHCAASGNTRPGNLVFLQSRYAAGLR
jgi:hypothetical protein